MENVLITICGRAGSKGVKSKNVRPFLGHPLIYYTLKAAGLFAERYQTSYHTDCIVSSDSKEILKIAKENGSVMRMDRSESLSQDDTPKVPVIQDAVLAAEEEQKKTYDYVVDLDITSPIRKIRDIDRAIAMCREDERRKYDLVFTATESRRNPYFNMVEIREEYAYKIKDSYFTARQQAPKVYDMNPSIYCYVRDSLIHKLKRITFEGRQGVLEVEDTYVIDIDRGRDFEMMEFLVEKFYMKEYAEIFE